MGGRYYSPAMKSFISSCNINELLYNINVPGNLNAYSIGNPVMCLMRTQRGMSNNYTILGINGIQNNNYSIVAFSRRPNIDPVLNNYWKSSWFNSKGKWSNWTGNVFQTTNGNFTFSAGSLKFRFLRFTNKGFQVVNARFDALRADYQIANNVNFYSTGGSAAGYIGFDYEKGAGIYAKASALSIGGNIGPVGGRLDIGSIGVVFVFEKGKLEVGGAIGVGGTVSVDLIWIIDFLEDVFGG